MRSNEPQRLNDSTPEPRLREDLIAHVLDCAFDVHRKLGPGLLENIYERGMMIEMQRRKIPFLRQHSCPVIYDGVPLDVGFRLDLLVDAHLIVELKAVERLAEIHRAQMLTYLRLTRYPIGLLINFNVVLLKDGIRRVVL